jgi:hypothetical protein
VVGVELDLPDEVYGFGSWLLWLLATRATRAVDRAFAAGPAREINSPPIQGRALAGLGRCALAGGRTADARDALRQAHEVFQRTGADEAAEVAAELSALAGPAPTA